MDFEQMIKDLQVQAKKTAKDLAIDEKMRKGKDLGKEAIEKIKTDRDAQIAAGAGGLLLAAILGTKGGRRFVGGAAKTGAVAGLGILAYKAWQDRQGLKSKVEQTAAQLGFVTDRKMEPEFAEALVRTMVSAAWADGNLNKKERDAISGSLKEAGAAKRERDLLTNDRPEAETFKKITAAAKTPNHAAQLYTAACVVTGTPTRSEKGFLARLAGALSIEPQHAAAIRAQVESV